MANLSEQLADLANPAPVFKDPEESLDIETTAKVADKDELDSSILDDDLFPSALRKKNIKVLGDTDKSYAGRTISRKELEDEDEAGLSDDFENDDSRTEDEQVSDEDTEISEFKNIFSQNKSNLKKKSTEASLSDSAISEDDVSEEEDSDEGISDDVSEEDDSDVDQIKDEDDSMELEDDEDTDASVVQKFSEIGFADDIEKGKAVKAQLSMWDSLLECRIKMQKLLLLVNQLPQPNTWNTFMNKTDKSFHSTLENCQNDTKELMNHLIEMQTDLLKRNADTECVLNDDDPAAKLCVAEKLKSEVEDAQEPSKIKNKLKRKLKVDDYNAVLSKRHKNFIEFRNQTIQKWSDKTRVASGKLSHKSFSGFDQSVVKQINQILNDKSRLIKRTQLKRSTYKVLGKVEQDEQIDVKEEEDQQGIPNRSEHLQNYDPEIFDDGDFYHQLLRELIERKTADVNNPIALGRQWLEIQKLRGKIKKKVDTKASKGRKIRYTVMSKLVNFMAPIADNNMNDEAKNELFGSLFGKRSTIENPNISVSFKN